MKAENDLEFGRMNYWHWNYLLLFAPWILLLSFVCLWCFLIKCSFMCVFSRSVCGIKLDSVTIVIEVSEQIHCKLTSGPSYLMPATVCKTNLFDLSWYMFMKTVLAVSGALHSTPWCIRYLPRLAAFFLPLFSSLPLLLTGVALLHLWGEGCAVFYILDCTHFHLSFKQELNVV